MHLIEHLVVGQRGLLGFRDGPIRQLLAGGDHDVVAGEGVARLVVRVFLLEVGQEVGQGGGGGIAVGDLDGDERRGLPQVIEHDADTDAIAQPRLEVVLVVEPGGELGALVTDRFHQAALQVLTHVGSHFLQRREAVRQPQGGDLLAGRWV